MKKKSLVEKFTFWARNMRVSALFQALKQYCRGDVLDVGGRDFYLLVKERDIAFSSWTTLDRSDKFISVIQDEKFRLVIGDGCQMSFEEGQFDTVVNVLVLEHVFEPQKMVNEMARVLKKGGHGIFLIPQTAVLHELPEHYYNFTRFWIYEAMKQAGLQIVELNPVGGVWSSMASHLVYFFLQSFRAQGLSARECKRNAWFYILFPLMAVYAVISIPLCLILGWGDLTEEPNYHLVVTKKNK